MKKNTTTSIRVYGSTGINAKMKRIMMIGPPGRPNFLILATPAGTPTSARTTAGSSCLLPSNVNSTTTTPMTFITAEAARAAKAEVVDLKVVARAAEAKEKADTLLTSLMAGKKTRIRMPIGAKDDGKEAVGKDQKVRAEAKANALTKAPRAKEKEKEKASEEKVMVRILMNLLPPP